jgi:hypothetical protein
MTRVFRVLDVLPVPELLKKVKISEPVGGGGKTRTKKNVVFTHPDKR